MMFPASSMAAWRISRKRFIALCRLQTPTQLIQRGDGLHAGIRLRAFSVEPEGTQASRGARQRVSLKAVTHVDTARCWAACLFAGGEKNIALRFGHADLFGHDNDLKMVRDSGALQLQLLLRRAAVGNHATAISAHPAKER